MIEFIVLNFFKNKRRKREVNHNLFQFFLSLFQFLMNLLHFLSEKRGCGND